MECFPYLFQVSCQRLTGWCRKISLSFPPDILYSSRLISITICYNYKPLWGRINTCKLLAKIQQHLFYGENNVKSAWLFHCADKNRHRCWLWRCLCNPASTALFIYFFVIIFSCLLDGRTASVKTLITLAGPRAQRGFILNQRQSRQRTRGGEPQPVFTFRHRSDAFVGSMITDTHTGMFLSGGHGPRNTEVRCKGEKGLAVRFKGCQIHPLAPQTQTPGMLSNLFWVFLYHWRWPASAVFHVGPLIRTGRVVKLAAKQSNEGTVSTLWDILPL